MGCYAGGRIIAQGLDNGDGGGITANGQLETGEIDSMTTFCSRFVINLLKDIYSGSGSSTYGEDPAAIGTPSISQPLTEPMERNCGRAMGPP